MAKVWDMPVTTAPQIQIRVRKMLMGVVLAMLVIAALGYGENVMGAPVDQDGCSFSIRTNRVIPAVSSETVIC